MDFFEKNKRWLIILGFFTFVVLMAFLLYKAFFKPLLPGSPEPAVETTTPGSATGGLQTSGKNTFTPGKNVEETGLTPEQPSAEKPGSTASETAEGGITKLATISDIPSSGLGMAADGRSARYYNKEDGLFYRAGADGQMIPMSDKVFHNVEQVTWSPSSNKAVLEYPDGANIVHDFDSQKSVTLPKHWEDFTFSKSGDRLALKSYGLDPDNRFLAISAYDGTEAKIIEELGENGDKVYPSWSPNSQVVALYAEGKDFNRQEVYFIGQNKENFKSMIIDGRGFQFEWTPNGDKLMYSAYSENSDLKPTLWLADAQGDNIGGARQKLNLDTWADKCVFGDSTTMYCGVPTTLERGAGIIEEMQKKTSDEIYQVDITTGTKKLIAIPETSINVSDPTITQDGKYFYFTDSFTQKIQRITLK